MPGKKKPAWRSCLLGLALTALLYLVGILAITLLTVRGIVGEERTFLILAFLALVSVFIGSLIAGAGKAGAGGSLLCAALFCLLLLMVCLGLWDGGLTQRGLILLGIVLTGGASAALLRRKVGKKSGKRLVKIHKKVRSG